MTERNGLEAESWRPRVPPALDVAHYALPEDRNALRRLRTLAPLVHATRMYLKHVGEPMAHAQLLGGAVRVTERQFPHLHRLVTEAARVLHMAPPDVFVLQHPLMNAHTYGHERPVVVLNSGLVDAMTGPELAFTLGHEFGHIKSEHVLFLNLAEFLRTGAAAVLQWAAAPAALAIFAWQRYAEHTADRAGFIVAQQIEHAQSALIKLALGSRRLFEQVDVEEYLRQNGQLDSLPARAVLVLQGHPFTARRVLALRAYATSADYAALWSTSAAATPSPAPPTLLQRLGSTVGAVAAECGYHGRTAAARLRERARASLRAVPLPGALAARGDADLPAVEARADEEPV